MASTGRAKSRAPFINALCDDKGERIFSDVEIGFAKDNINDMRGISKKLGRKMGRFNQLKNQFLIEPSLEGFEM